MQPITHSDLMVLIDTDMQDALQSVIDEPTTHGIIVLGNTVFIPYGPSHPCKAPADATNAMPPATYFYVKENCNVGNHDQDRTQVRPDADLPDLSEGDTVCQTVPTGNADAGADRRYQGARLHGKSPATPRNLVSETEWVDRLTLFCPLMVLASSSGLLIFTDRYGIVRAAYRPIDGSHYLTP